MTKSKILKYMIILDSPLVISIIAIFILKWFYFDIQNSLLALLNGFFTFLTILAKFTMRCWQHN